MSSPNFSPLAKATLNPTPLQILQVENSLSPTRLSLGPTPVQILQIDNSRSPTRLTLGPTPTKLIHNIFPTPSTFVLFTRNPTPSNFEGNLRVGDDDDAGLIADDAVPTNEPSPTSASIPTYPPTNEPSTIAPTTSVPTFESTFAPSSNPTYIPTFSPTTSEPSHQPTFIPTTPTFYPTPIPTFNRVFSNADIGIILTSMILLVACCIGLCVFGFCFGFGEKKKAESMPLIPSLPSLPKPPDLKPPEMPAPPNLMAVVNGFLQRLRGGKGGKGVSRRGEDEEDEVEDDGGGFIVMPSAVPGEDTKKLNKLLSKGKSIELYTSKGPRKVKLTLIDNSELRWELATPSSGSKKYKLELRDVLLVQIGKNTKNLKGAQMDSNLCLSLIFQSLTLDIVAESHEQRDGMVHGFNEIVTGLKTKPI